MTRSTTIMLLLGGAGLAVFAIASQRKPASAMELAKEDPVFAAKMRAAWQKLVTEVEAKDEPADNLRAVVSSYPDVSGETMGLAIKEAAEALALDPKAGLVLMQILGEMITAMAQHGLQEQAAQLKAFIASMAPKTSPGFMPGPDETVL